MSELSLRRGPIQLVLSRGLWRSFWYLLGYLAVGWVLFAVAVAVGGAGLSVTLAGLTGLQDGVLSGAGRALKRARRPKSR